MKVKTYQSRSLQEALDNVKRDLGGEALILSTRSVNARPPFGLFKRQKWEITAALDEPKPAVETNTETKQRPAVTAPVRSASAAAAAPALAPVAVNRPEVEAPRVRKDERMDALIEEIGELKKSFRTLSNAMPSKGQDVGGGLYAELISSGIEQELADHLVRTGSRGKPTPSELRDRVRRLLADQMVIEPAAELVGKSRMVSVFVGPTGVGKTTTIAKIAGHASIRMKKKVALISTDLFRVGGQEQLKRFGELLGVPTYGCADAGTLKELVRSLDDRDLVMIDTQGSSPSDLARLAKLEGVINSADAKVHLVVSATTRSEDITKIVARFMRFSPRSVIFTKIDETDAKGAIAGDLLRNELAISYIGNGQRVPEDLVLPAADDLARFVLPSEPAI